MNRGYWLVGMAALGLVVMLGLAGVMGAWTLATAADAAQEGAPGATAPAAGNASDGYRTFGLALGAALAAGISIIGAGLAVGRVGSAAIGALAEKPEMMGRTIVFIGLAEGLGVLGFAIAVLLLLQIGK
jgi:V/A-type H+-transporting ATPase subunit K